MQVGLELGWGIPYGWLFAGNLKGVLVDHKYSIGRVDTDSNVRIGAVWSYVFPLHDNKYRLGPEVGLAYSRKRRINIPIQFLGNTITLEERYLSVPIGIRYDIPQSGGTGYNSLLLGFEFDILLSSYYTWSKARDHIGVLVAFYKEHAATREAIPDLPRFTGSIFFDSIVVFPKGFYFRSRTRLPVVALAKLSTDSSALFLLHINRVCTTSWIELSFGVNLLEWF